MSWLYEYTKHIIGLPPVDGGQCVRLVEHYIPEIGHTSLWRKGELVIASRSLVRGMAIANFNAKGLWPGHAHNNHAALLWDWGGRYMDSGLVSWIEIVEQFEGSGTIQLRCIHRKGFTRRGALVDPSNSADAFYVIEKKGQPNVQQVSRQRPPAHHFVGDRCPDRNEGEAVSNENIISSNRWR